MVNHAGDKRREGNLWLPAQMLPRLAGVAKQVIDFRRAKIPWVNLDVIPPVELHVGKRRFEKLPYRVSFTRGDDVVIRGCLLEHPPHGFDVIAGKAPVTLGVEVAQVEFSEARI